MNKEELHRIVADGHPNICQIVAIKDNEIVYSDMTLDVNHRFIDGYFVGQFVQKLEEKIAELI